MESDGLYDFVEEAFSDLHRLPTIEEVWDAAHKRGEAITKQSPAPQDDMRVEIAALADMIEKYTNEQMDINRTWIIHKLRLLSTRKG